MSLTVLLVVCGTSVIATILGWFAARLTMDDVRDMGGRSAPPSGGDKQTGLASRLPTNVGEGSVTFAGVIRLNVFSRLRQVMDGDKADELLSGFAGSVAADNADFFPGRIGDDSIDFCLVAPSKDDARDTLLDILYALDKPILHGSQEFQPRPRAGVAEIVGTLPSQSSFDAARHAVDHPMFQDRQVVFVDASHFAGATKSAAEVVSGLRSALSTDEVTLVYQPKFDVRAESFRTAEALFRWDSDEGRQLTVGELIMSAERHGVIRDLTLWSLKRAVSDQLQLMDHDIELTTFVNLSGHLISDSEFTLEAIEIIKAAQGRIGIEITETSVIEHAGHALSNLELYNAAGAEIAIDDYGTGLSSLRYLKRIPAQELKIDREFIKDLTSSHRDPMIVRSTIDLAHALGLKVTAEGVDDPTKVALLKVMGCDQLQGFHVARPMPLTDLIAFMGDTERQKKILSSKVSLLPEKAKAQG